MHTIAVAIRHATMMDEEETRLLDGIDETIEQLKDDGVSEEDCKVIRKQLEAASRTTDPDEYAKCFERVVDVLMQYVGELEKVWRGICDRFGVNRSFDRDAVTDLVEIYCDLEWVFGS